MTPVDIARRTRAIGAPRNWDPKVDGQCGVLSVRDGASGRSPTMTSAWRPDEQELKWLQQGNPILLTVFGTIHPVVSMSIGGPDDAAA